MPKGSHCLCLQRIFILEKIVGNKGKQFLTQKIWREETHGDLPPTIAPLFLSQHRAFWGTSLWTYCPRRQRCPPPFPSAHASELNGPGHVGHDLWDIRLWDRHAACETLSCNHFLQQKQGRSPQSSVPGRATGGPGIPGGGGWDWTPGGPAPLEAQRPSPSLSKWVGVLSGTTEHSVPCAFRPGVSQLGYRLPKESQELSAVELVLLPEHPPLCEKVLLVHHQRATNLTFHTAVTNVCLHPPCSHPRGLGQPPPCLCLSQSLLSERKELFPMLPIIINLINKETGTKSVKSVSCSVNCPFHQRGHGQQGETQLRCWPVMAPGSWPNHLNKALNPQGFLRKPSVFLFNFCPHLST